MTRINSWRVDKPQKRPTLKAKAHRQGPSPHLKQQCRICNVYQHQNLHSVKPCTVLCSFLDGLDRLGVPLATKWLWQTSLVLSGQWPHLGERHTFITLSWWGIGHRYKGGLKYQWVKVAPNTYPKLGAIQIPIQPSPYRYLLCPFVEPTPLYSCLV